MHNGLHIRVGEAGIRGRRDTSSVVTGLVLGARKCFSNISRLS